MWLGQDSEIKAAIPDAFFKIVLRLGSEGVDTLAFLIRNILPKAEPDLNIRLTSIDRIEELTGLDFLTALEDTIETSVESQIASNFCLVKDPPFSIQPSIFLPN